MQFDLEVWVTKKDRYLRISNFDLPKNLRKSIKEFFVPFVQFSVLKEITEDEQYHNVWYFVPYSKAQNLINELSKESTRFRLVEKYVPEFETKEFQRANNILSGKILI